MSDSNINDLALHYASWGKTADGMTLKPTMGAPYKFSFHPPADDGALGHSVIFAPVGTGMNTTMAFLAAHQAAGVPVPPNFSIEGPSPAVRDLIQRLESSKPDSDL